VVRIVVEGRGAVCEKERLGIASRWSRGLGWNRSLGLSGGRALYDRQKDALLLGLGREEIVSLYGRFAIGSAMALLWSIPPYDNI
jgi:hypothetical protein